jgi:hypothetical protein
MSIKTSFDLFGKRVIKQSKSNLTKKGKNASKELYNSLGYNFKQNKNSFEFSFEMETYGKFIDKGVKGAGGVRSTTSKFKKKNNKGKLWKLKKVDNNLYKYGKSGGISPKHFTQWAKRKGLSPFAVAKSVYHTGLETTNFFTKPFKNEFEKLPNDIVKAYGLEVEKFLKFTLN